jgi:7-cyano-7-deazaguanine synthase
MANLAQKRAIEGNQVRIETPLINLSKADIIRLGLDLEAPLYLSWSCYEEGDHPCGACDSCMLRARGFEEAGRPDTALTGVEI